jgi:hypothetical protein
MNASARTELARKDALKRLHEHSPFVQMDEHVRTDTARPLTQLALPPARSLPPSLTSTRTLYPVRADIQIFLLYFYFILFIYFMVFGSCAR